MRCQLDNWKYADNFNSILARFVEWFIRRAPRSFMNSSTIAWNLQDVGDDPPDSDPKRDDQYAGERSDENSEW